MTERDFGFQRISRRGLLAGLGSSAALLAAGPGAGKTRPEETIGDESDRLTQACKIRIEAARTMLERGAAAQEPNGDEGRYPNGIASFTKGLPHDERGEVDPAAFRQLLHALETGDPLELEEIPLGGWAKLANPQAAYGTELVGPDPCQLSLPPAPRFDSAAQGAETVELYWHALLRDVPFAEYPGHELVERAAGELTGLEGEATPRVDGRVTEGTIFRGPASGDLVGPYVSQFLWQPIPYRPLTIHQKARTTVAGEAHLGNWGEWLANQNGSLARPNAFDEEERYLRNGRDLGEYVHRDFAYQPYLSAALLLVRWATPFDGGNPYKHSKTQGGFATFGPPHVLNLLAQASQLALDASWFQKWLVHRRLRPEAYGGRVEARLTGRSEYPIPTALLESEAVRRLREERGSALLPQAYPEGAPLHPSYPAAHAVIAGACVAVLKAFFDETWVVPAPVVASADGRRLDPWRGATLTVGGELDKLASNISIGRDFAGVHYRSDSIAGITLGEEVAIAMLRERGALPGEIFTGLSLTRFDGTRVTI